MKINRFEDLPIWKIALSITRKVYDITSVQQFNRDFCLRDQLRRSVISISANIVEGFEKNNNNEFIRYLKISKGSIGETRNHIYIAYTVGYLKKAEFDRLNEELISLGNQVGAFIVYLEKVRQKGQFIKR